MTSRARLTRHQMRHDEIEIAQALVARLLRGEMPPRGVRLREPQGGGGRHDDPRLGPGPA